MTLEEIGKKIDASSEKGNTTGITDCINELNLLLENDKNKTSSFYVNYYLSNAYYCLYQITNPKNDLKKRPNNIYLQKAKKYYRIVTKESDKLNIFFKKQLLVNFGNCLDYLGRSIEALDLYNEALIIDPKFSMALGNKAIAANYFSSITGIYRGAITIETYQILKQIITDPELVRIGGVAAKNYFNKEADKIGLTIKNKLYLKKKIKHKPYSKKNLSEFEISYLDFCINNDLFLNFHIQDKNCEAAVCDPIFIETITKINDETSFYNLARYINQIKEDYSVARVLLFQSEFRKNKDFSNISKRTNYVYPLDYSQCHIYNGFLKSAFKTSYDILDKIAVFLNTYFDLGISENQISFDSNPEKNSCIWTKKIKDEKSEELIIKDELLEKGNISLFALFDIFLDFRNQEYKTIKDIRNAITHRQLTVFEDIVEKKEKIYVNKILISISHEEFLIETIKLMKLIKAAIIYTVNCVNLKEGKKGNKGVIEIPVDNSQFL